MLTVGGGQDRVGGTFLGALRAGALIGYFELGVELAPVTWVPHFDLNDIPVLSVSATVGGHIPITDHFFWPMRFRAGMVAVNTPNDDPVTLLGLDLIGLGYRFDENWILEANAPSFRYAGVFDDAKVPDSFSWPINISGLYVF